MDQFDSFTASQLYCSKCQKSMPVRQKLLLVLPDKEVYDYLCTGCATSLGTREISLTDQPLHSLVRKSRLKKKS
jgi:hypothetical protein